MQQFTVPQFIDVEEKVIGPITVRQFVIMLFATGLDAVFYKLFYFNTFIVATVLTVFITAVFAFGKVNGVHFHLFLSNFLITMFKSNVRVWNNAFGKDNLRIETEKVASQSKDDVTIIKNYSASRLAELALIVDTQGVFRGNDPNRQDLPDFKREIHDRHLTINN
jgi:hypothetical protein